MSERTVRSYLQTWLPRLVGIAILFYILHRIGLKTPKELLGRLGLPAFFGILLLNIPHITFKALRWKTLVDRRSSGYSFLHALHAYFAGIALGIVTPGRAGEFFRAMFPVRAHLMSLSSSLAMVLCDRIYDLGFLLTLSFIATLWVIPGYAPVLAALCFFSGALLFLIFQKKIDGLFLRMVRRWRITP
ncbi:flippase-like domain-containing protein, partial [Myxococcota bacterium]|nr:flippase-like domain-containing protein [Myxococcota bacterium]